MPRYFFDIQIGDAVETDTIGSELSASPPISDLALDLCLQLARERLPDTSNIWVRVRGDDGTALYECHISLTGNWL